MGIGSAGPVIDILSAAGLIAIGILLFRHRREIGSLTGFYAGRGGRVDKPTPGWMLIPFAVALIALGCIVLYRSVVPE